MADELNQPTVEDESPEMTEEVADQEAEEVAVIEEETVAEATPAEVEAAEEEAGLTESSEEPVATQRQHPDFRAGDTVRVGVQITEGDKTRVQYFEGMVLARKGAGISQTFTVRKVAAGGIAVERIFPLYAPIVSSIEVRRRGVVRRAKLYFLRDIVGSTANVIKEKKVVRTAQETQAARAAKRAAKAEAKPVKAPKTPKTKTKDKTKATRSSKRAAKKTV